MKKMKINKISGLSVMLLTVISACTVQDNIGPDETLSQAISVIADAKGPGTKTALNGIETQWTSEDKIGLFSPQAKVTADGTPEANPAKNVAFTAQTPAKSSTFKGSMYWGSASSEHTFYAYYPYNSGYTGDQTTFPISLSPAQTQSAAGNTAHIGALDFMVATPLAVTPPGTVNFTFSHVFAMIEFQIKGSGTLTQINLIGADPLACEGTINLSQTPGTNTYAITTSSTSDFVSVTLGTGATLSSTAVSVYMMVLPGAQSKNMQVALKIDGNWKILDKTPPTGGFSRGQKYVVSLDTESTTAGWFSTMTDARDGYAKTYNLVVIGGQIWMKENLAYLPEVVGVETGSEDSGYEEEAFYYVYKNEATSKSEAKATSNYQTYGVLYNWTAAKTACPPGWHLPGNAEWTQLTDYLGKVIVAGGKMKETGTTHWKSPNSAATDESGFTALPGGSRMMDGTFSNIGIFGCWWSLTEDIPGNPTFWSLDYSNGSVGRPNGGDGNGFSVRCLRND